MAFAHLLRPKINLPIFRLSKNHEFARFSCFSAATARFSTSKRCNGGNDNRPPSEKEAAAERTGITPMEYPGKESLLEKTCFFSKATSVFGLMVRYVGSTNSERLSVQYTGHQTESKAENEERKGEAALSDDQNVRFEGAERSFQSDSSPNVIGLIDKDNQIETTAENEGRKAESALSDCQNESSEGAERSFQSDCCPEVLGLKSLEIEKPTDSKRLSVLFTEHNNKQTITTAENEGRKDEAALLDYQNERADVSFQSNTSPKALSLKSASDGSVSEIDSRTDLVEDNSLNANLQRSDKDTMLNLLDFLDRPPSIEDKETSNSGNRNVELTGLKTCFKVPTINEDQRQRQHTCPPRTESVKNRVLVRFLESNIPENPIRERFNPCGEILKIEVPSVQGPIFKAVYIDFKTKEGFEKALKKSGSLLSSGTVIVESADVMKNMTVNIPIPGLLNDPDIPSALVKNPTRTIKIEKLTKGTSSHHIEEALSFCKSNISGYTLGSSHSVAYVEFESEMGKERALAKQFINVSGRQLVMLRIDCPRTTVVRISTMDNRTIKETISICRSLGDVDIFKTRGPGMLDVQFNISEWPNMVKILNGLNGRIVEGQRLQAEPAPIFPPEVLLALWNHPEERKCLEATAQALLHKVSEITSDISELGYLEKEFFCRFD